MNIFIQNILVGILFGIAISFLIKKFFWKPQIAKSNKKLPGSCDKGGCGCH